METALFGGPPELGNILKLGNGQVGFMNTFAYPLFESVTDLLPAMSFTVKEITANRSIWSVKVEHERRRIALQSETPNTKGDLSPRSQSPVRKPGQALRDGVNDEHSHSPATPTRLNAELPATPRDPSPRSSAQGLTSTPERASPTSPGASPGTKPKPPPLLARQSSNTLPSSQPSLNHGGVNGSSSSETRSIPSTSNLGTSDFAHGIMRGKEESTASGGADIGPPTDLFIRARQDDRRMLRNCSPGPTSAPSSYALDTRATSGTRTQSSVANPFSPSTQATSFLTVDSDEKDSQMAESRPHSASVPAITNPDRPIPDSKNSLRTSMMGNGVSRENSEDSLGSRRKSRLRLAFWRKKTGSPEGRINEDR